jgi:hypothetical protein
MKTRIGTLAVLTAALACAPAYAAPVKVKLRVEGATKTIFEGRVTTDVHQVTGDESGPHKCDGTNGGAHPTPGPTAIGALDDASDSFNFSWSGSWNDEFEEFLVNQIGPDSANDQQFWGLAVNGKDTELGGCQTQVRRGQEVLFAYDAFNKKHILLLSGPSATRVGKRESVKVVDGRTGEPVKGATVGGKETNAKGVARLRFRSRGVRRLKARHPDAVRSNQIRVKVQRRR